MSDKSINTQPHTTEWITNSNDGGGCVEVRRNGMDVEVRDTKNREGGTLTFTLEEMHRFIDGANKGVFDHIVY